MIPPQPADVSGHEWVALCRQDPGAALDLAYRLHAGSVRATASSFCGPDLAVDVAQEVFLRLWRAPDRFDPDRASLRTYLSLLARGVAIDAVRSEQRRRRRNGAEASHVAPTWSDDQAVVEPVLAAETRRRVIGALAQLEPDPRAAVEAIYLQARTFVETAHLSGTPEGTLKSRVRSGLRQLEPLLADLGDEAGSSTAAAHPVVPPAAARPVSVRQRRRARIAAAVAGLTVAGLAMSGCANPSSSDATEGQPGRVRIVTTVAPITSIVSSIVGDLADVVGIVPEGTNSHTYEPRPSVAAELSTADVVYVNGLGLEEPVVELAEDQLRDGAVIVELGALTLSPDEYLYDFSFPESGGRPNPHLWTDPTLARRYAEIVKDDMSLRDPENATAYAANFDEFSTIVDEFDAAMRVAFATVPVRELLTYHDAYAYFAETYDWKVIGAIQMSDFEDPTPGDVAALIDQVRDAGVPAIFGSEVFPSPVLEQIGREAGVAYVDVLRDDDLPGSPGDPEHSWLGLMRFDFVTMTEALGGDATALRDLTIRASAPDTAVYPQ